MVISFTPSSSSSTPGSNFNQHQFQHPLTQHIQKQQQEDMVGISLDQIISALSSVPFVGRRLVGTAINRSTQRHKCDTCGDLPEVNVGDIVKYPLALLSDRGFQLHAREFKPENTNDDGKIVLSSFGKSSVPEPPASEEKQQDKQISAEQQRMNEETTIAKTDDATNASSSASPTKLVDKRPRFACPKPSCSGRLGIHTFKGDSTDGSKEKLVERIKKVFKAMPELVETHMTAESVEAFEITDVYWVD